MCKIFVGNRYIEGQPYQYVDIIGRQYFQKRNGVDRVGRQFQQCYLFGEIILEFEVSFIWILSEVSVRDFLASFFQNLGVVRGLCAREITNDQAGL